MFVLALSFAFLGGLTDFAQAGCGNGGCGGYGYAYGYGYENGYPGGYIHCPYNSKWDGCRCKGGDKKKYDWWGNRCNGCH